MPEVQDLTRYLGALAASPSGEIIHYIHQTKGSLVEKKFDKQWSVPTIVGPAKIGTSAAYSIRGSQRIVIALNEVNILQDYEYSEDDGEWTPGNLAVEGELQGHLQSVIQKYVDMLRPTKDNYLVFQFSRIGDDVGAKKLLEDLDNLTELTQYIDCQPADIGFKLVNDAIHSDQFDLVVELMIGAIAEAVDG